MTDIKSCTDALIAQLNLVPTGTDSGPVVDLHYFRVARGTRMSDLKSTIAKHGFYSDWRRGDAGDQIAIGIPHADRKVVSLSALVGDDAFRKSDAVLPIILGVDALGNPVVADLAQMPHLMISGNDGTGKSMLLASIVASINAHPSAADHRIVNINASDAVTQIGQITAEMSRRYDALRAARARDIACCAGLDMVRMIVVMDELDTIMAAHKKTITESLANLVSYARTVGIHIIIAASRIDSKTLSGAIKANFPARISFRVDTAAASRQSLGENGAELLLPYGDALFSVAGRIPTRIHTPYLDV